MNLHVAMPRPIETANQSQPSLLPALVAMRNQICDTGGGYLQYDIPNGVLDHLAGAIGILEEAVIDAPVRSKNDVIAKLQLLTDMVANEDEFLNEPKAFNAAIQALTKFRNSENMRWFGRPHPFYGSDDE
nr:hypothetical protein RKHAN_01860 [Rhizobium sp. Khangiran2]